MKIKEILEKMDDFTEEEREKLLGKLIGMFTPESIGTITNFQNNWIDSDKAKGIQRSFEEFTKAQNNVVRDCVKIENSEFGATVRSLRELPVFDIEVEIE